eukprot:scaffold23240_cov27-Tisochrysis_lutea.AAC.5
MNVPVQCKAPPPLPNRPPPSFRPLPPHRTRRRQSGRHTPALVPTSTPNIPSKSGLSPMQLRDRVDIIACPVWLEDCYPAPEPHGVSAAHTPCQVQEETAASDPSFCVG